jgi:hypothetical protein
MAAPEIHRLMRRPAHPLDDLFAEDLSPFAPLYRRATFGKYAFKNVATLQAFAEAQRALYEIFDHAGRKRQRELLIKLCDTGSYPQPPPPLRTTADPHALLTPEQTPEKIGSRTYRRFGAYLVQEEIVADFIRAHEHLAHYDEERVAATLSALRMGGPHKRQTKLVDNEEWNAAFIPSPDEDGCLIIQWDRRMMLSDPGGAIVSSPLLLLHEEQHAVDFLNDPAGTTVLQATPSKEYGNHLEGNMIAGLERIMLAAMGFPPRQSYHALVVGALSLTSTQTSLGVARASEETHRIGEHETIGQIVAIRNHEVLIRDEQGNIIRYDVRELSHFMGASVDRTAEGAPKRILNTLHILDDAGLHKDQIKIAIHGTGPPTYHNPQQILRQGKTRAQHFHLPKNLGRSRTR